MRQKKVTQDADVHALNMEHNIRRMYLEGACSLLEGSWVTPVPQEDNIVFCCLLHWKYLPGDWMWDACVMFLWLTQANQFPFVLPCHLVKRFIGSKHWPGICEIDSSPKWRLKQLFLPLGVQVPYAPVEVSLCQTIQGHREAFPSWPYHPQNPPLLANGTVERIPQTKVIEW